MTFGNRIGQKHFEEVLRGVYPPLAAAKSFLFLPPPLSNTIVFRAIYEYIEEKRVRWPGTLAGLPFWVALLCLRFFLLSFSPPPLPFFFSFPPPPRIAPSLNCKKKKNSHETRNVAISPSRPRQTPFWSRLLQSLFLFFLPLPPFSFLGRRGRYGDVEKCQ